MRITLKRPLSDGTVAVDMDPLSLLCRLAASVPPPRFHTVRYAGVLAPASKLTYSSDGINVPEMLWVGAKRVRTILAQALQGIENHAYACVLHMHTYRSHPQGSIHR